MVFDDDDDSPIEFSNTVGFLNPPAEMLENICIYERRPRVRMHNNISVRS